MQKTTFWKLISGADTHIVIPVNQREYAQGRLNSESTRIRKNLVATLHEALTGAEHQSLDLIYGSLIEGKFVPYDGQQRLTTLFLLHWLLALRSGELGEGTRKLLHAFRYDLREETEKFCNRIIDEFNQDPAKAPGVGDLRKYMVDAAWYDAKWNRDPSIRGMLTMLEALDRSFADDDYRALWQKLVGTEAISFYYEEIGAVGTTGEELYITMNSRGKELSAFEKFKPKLLGFIREKYPVEKCNRFCANLDGKWLDFFWTQFGMSAAPDKKAETTDACFFNFLLFVFDMLRELSQEKGASANMSSLDPVEELYRLATLALNPDQKIFWPGHDNLDFLEAVLDKLCALPGAAQDLFDSYFFAADSSKMPVSGRISWFERSANLLAFICANPREGNARRHMLLGFLLWLISDQEDSEPLRHLRNLVYNSENEFGRDAWRAEYPRRQLLGMSTLILKGMKNISAQTDLKETFLGSCYNDRQLQEELAKYQFVNANQNYANMAIWLENHPFLRGNLAVAYVPAGDTPAFNGQILDNIHNLFQQCFNQDMIEWDSFLVPLLATGAFRWWTKLERWRATASLRLYTGRTIERRQIFIGQAPVERLPYSQTSVQRIAAWVKTAVSKAHASSKISARISTWLATKEKEQCLDWIWYFVKYPEMLPDYPDVYSEGYYHWGYSGRSFLQRELGGANTRGTNWNPFLWAVWVQGGLAERMESSPGLDWIENAGRNSDNYIIFPCGLTLWAGEFGWLVRTPTGRRPKSTAFHNLQNNFKGINVNGYFYVPGKSMIEGKEVTRLRNEWKEELDWETEQGNWRICDSRDRIGLGVRLALEILKL